MVLELLPPECVVGLITFGAAVHVYELGFEAMPKAHVFSGERDVPVDKLRNFLGLGAPRAAAGQPVAANNAFLRP
jgi:protein transport protein SEC23